MKGKFIKFLQAFFVRKASTTPENQARHLLIYLVPDPALVGEQIHGPLAVAH